MRIIQINTVFPEGSTGKICKSIAQQCSFEGMENYVAYAQNVQRISPYQYEIQISSWLDHHVHNRLARMTMGIGSFSYFHTQAFLKTLKKLRPDIIHLHNLHGNYINLRLLFKYIKNEHIPVVWTLHDCWAFTGYCTYYLMVSCNKWKSQCETCPNRHLDSVTVFDRSRTMFLKKKALFGGVDNMTLVTPSMWLKKETEQSFMKEYPVRVIRNGIDLNIFKPRDSEFRSKCHIGENQFMVLGVSFVWDKRKGLDVFCELAKRLGSSYQIVLVGTNDMIDQQLPTNIISIHRTQDQIELAEIYSAADLFVNPTREDNYPTVNLEAVACGTPVVTFDTGGSAEMLNEMCGSVVTKNDIDLLEKEIVRICQTKPYTQEECLRHALSYDQHTTFQEYTELYKELYYDSVTNSRT